MKKSAADCLIRSDVFSSRLDVCERFDWNPSRILGTMRGMARHTRGKYPPGRGFFSFRPTFHCETGPVMVSPKFHLAQLKICQKLVTDCYLFHGSMRMGVVIDDDGASFA